MNTAIESGTEAAKPGRTSARKQIASILDPFTEPLLQMDDEAKPLHEMVAWLQAQGTETTGANVAKFLTSRRQRRVAKQQLDGEKDLTEALQEWLEENPIPKPAAVCERFKMLAVNLSLRPAAAPEVLKLADRLARTASRVANDESRAEYRERKLVMEEAKHAERLKQEQERALELCLEQAKKYPAVMDMYRATFAAHRECLAQEKVKPKA